MYENLESFTLISQTWTADAARHGRSPSPRARHLRQRSLIMATLLLSLRKRLTEAEQLTSQIDKLITDEAAADDTQEAA